MNRVRNERFTIAEEIKLIPWWAVGLAVFLFFGMQALMTLVLFRRESNPPPVPFQLLLGAMMGTVLAFLVLLVGYVNRDAKRRGMNRALWTVLVIFIPNAIGFIIYFLLRQPLVAWCPRCGNTLNQGFNFCPKCGFNLNPSCPRCHHGVQMGDKYCPYCAYELTGERQPTESS